MHTPRTNTSTKCPHHFPSLLLSLLLTACLSPSMAPPPPSSLHDLLSADGFKNRHKLHNPPAAAPAAPPRAVSMPLQQRPTQKPARSQSDVFSRGRRNYTVVRSKSTIDIYDDDDDDDDGDELARRRTLTTSVKSHDNNGKRGSCSIPALDEAAFTALVSMVTGAVKRFAKDESFRASLSRGCNYCLGESDHQAVLDLRVVMQTVERVAKEGLDPRELKRASLKLEAVTSFDSKDVKAAIATGVPYSHLAACAHLYISVMFKLQKKDRASAEHVLQVFCCAPQVARTVLLPGLWDRLFRPGLSHLRSWYDKESEAVRAETASSEIKLKAVQKMYRDVLDKGTHELACYYRDWLQGQTEATALPVVPAPPATLHAALQCSSHEVSSDVVFSSGSSANSSKFTASERLQQSVAGELGDGSDDRDEKEEEEEVEEKIVDTQSLVHECDDEAKNSPKLQHELSPSHSGDGSISKDSCHPYKLVLQAKENELILKKLAKEIFEPHLEHSQCKESDVPRNTQILDISAMDLLLLEFCAGPLQSNKDGNQVSIFSTTPKDFLCPLTRHIFTDPVTLETGQTFERAAIKQWFDQGNRTCPVTGQELESLSIPGTNRVLKHLIDNWKSEHCKNLIAEDSKPEDKLDLSMVEKHLTGVSMYENLEKARHLMAIGGLDFLLRSFESGNVDEKTRVVELLLRCIEADGSCRNYLVTKLNSLCILQLLHSEQIAARSAAVRLLTQLLCLRRRATLELFLTGLYTESIVETMHTLLEHLQSSPPEEQALVAVLLLHFDLLVESHRNSIYREEAAKSITLALSCCLSEEKVVPNTRKALLLLGGHFSFSGDLLAEAWMLRKAGFADASRVASVDYDAENDENVQDKETIENKGWLKNVTLVLLGGGTRRPFLKALSKCINSGNSELVTTCLATVGWLSHSLASLDATDIQLAAFSAFIPRLKQSLMNTQQIQHRVLACLSLHNFSKIPDCRVLFMMLADGMRDHLKELTKLTWTADQLCRELDG